MAFAGQPNARRGCSFFEHKFGNQLRVELPARRQFEGPHLVERLNCLLADLGRRGKERTHGSMSSGDP